MQGSTANRLYAYKVEYQIGANGAWQVYPTNVTGVAMLNSTIVKTVPLVINTPNTACKVRVTDIYQNTIVATSGAFAVTPYVSNLNVPLVWDYSFSPQPITALMGVAADGVARCYIKVQKNAPVAANIQSATVSLSDGVNNTPAMLGKVLFATQTTAYSTEANNATGTTAQSPTAAASAEKWFWYVAPDDFSQSGTSAYANASERTVTFRKAARVLMQMRASAP